MIELFACKPHNVRLSTVACAGNWKMMNRGTSTPMPSIGAPGGSRSERVYGRAQCVGCEIGAAHARGEVVPVERLVWKAPAAAAAPATPPVTVVPRVEGVLDDKTAKKTAPSTWTRELDAEREAKSARARARDIEPEQGPRWDEPIREVHTADTEEHSAHTPATAEPQGERPMKPPRTAKERGEIIADMLAKELPISGYAAKYEIDQATLRGWLSSRGHDPKTWPKLSSGRKPVSAQVATMPAEVTSAAEALNEAIAKAERAAALEHVEDDEPSIGDVILPPPLEERAMARTELDLDTPIPFRPIEMISIPFEVASILASLGITSAIVHVAHLIYEVGHAYGRGAPDEAKAWTDRVKVASYRARG